MYPKTGSTYALPDQRSGHVSNSAAGHARLLALLREYPAVRIVCESTGGYERAMIAALLQAGLEVCLVQPARVRAFARAEGLLARTDRIDAALLRRFGEAMQPRLIVPENPAATTLRELLEHRRALSDQLVAVQNRLELAGATLRKLLERQRTFLKKELTSVEAMIHAPIDQDPDLHGKSERLQQMQGVGPVLAATLLAYVPELGSLESAQLSALLGVAPFARDSGNSNKPRHLRGGRAVVRHVLYMAAVAATRFNPVLSVFYKRMVAAGKPKMLCLVAVMRKMLRVLNRLIPDPHFALVR